MQVITWKLMQLLVLGNLLLIIHHAKGQDFCDGLRIRETAVSRIESKERFLEVMSNVYRGCRVVNGSVNILERPMNETYSSTDFEFLSSVEEIGDTLNIQNINVTDNITLPNLQLIRGRNLLEYLLHPAGNPALLIFNVTVPVYLPRLTEITLGDVYIVTVSSCNHRGVLWEDILTGPNSQYQDIGNDHCPSSTDIIASSCSRCEYQYCWSSELCQTLTKNFGTCFEDCSTRRCYLNIVGNPQCCSRECAAGCVGPNDNQCIACENFDNNGTCVTNCPPREVYNHETETFENNDDFRFHSGSLCIESCPSTRFEQGTFCVSECQPGFQTVGHVCEPCTNGVCMGGRICNGVDGGLLPAAVQTFSGCTIVNGDLTFNLVTYEQFIDQNVNLTQAREDLSSIKVILGRLIISGWGEEVFDYLPNLMYIGGFEGDTALPDTHLDSLEISDNNPSFSSLFTVSLTQIHFPKLVEISELGVYVVNNPTLCYIGELEYYITSSNLTVLYDGATAVRPYSECVAAGMSCHNQCNETYRCWGPADTDCVVCKVYLYRNGAERICVDSCESTRLQSLNVFTYADNSTMTCEVCHEECNDACSGPVPSDCFGRCENFALPTANNTITCVLQCPLGTYPNDTSFCLPCNSVCVSQTGCTGPSDRLEDGGCNRCYYVLRNKTLGQVRCLPDDGCIERTFLNLPFDPVEPFPFPTRFCDPCHEHCQSCSGPEAHLCSQCLVASRENSQGHSICVGSCEDGEYVSAKRCLLCHEECDGCIGGSQQECIACQNIKNFLGDDDRFECLSSGRCPSNKYENMVNSICDQCHPYCAECVGPESTNCTSCNDPPGYTIIPPEGDDLGLFGCCDTNSTAVEENQTCVPRQSRVSPEILSDIVDSTDGGRDLANFTCQATGGPVPTISWYFNDVMINVSDTSKYMIMSTSINTSTTENTLTVYNVTSSDVGTYTCNATNTLGSDISHGCLAGMDYQLCGLHITCDNFRTSRSCRNSTCDSGCFCSNEYVLDGGVCVHPYMCPIPPSITYPMNNITTVIIEGDTAAFTCEAVGYPPPKIVWSKTNGALSDRVSVSDSVSVPTGSGNVTSVSVTLTITNASREETGLYQCTASNSVGNDTRTVSGCLAGMEYQPCGLHTTCSDLSRVRSCQSLPCGSGCFCSNGNVLENEVCTHPGMCPILPRITVPLENSTEIITKGDTITITCEALGYPPPTIVWSKTNGALISDRVSESDSVSVPFGSLNVPSVSVNLTITNADREDMGVYQCTASNSVSRYFNITVLGVMCENLTTTVEGSVITNCQSGVSGYGRDGDTCVITYHNVMELWVCQESRQWTTMSILELPSDIFSSQTVNVLESVSFTCVTRGTPMLSLSWSFPISDDRVNIRTNRNGTQLTSILTIGSTLLSDTGVYICNASNQQFSGYVSYNLTVVPLLQENAQSIRVLEGQSVTLRCVPTPDTLTVGWIFNGDNLYESDKFTFSPQNLNHTLSITNPGVEDMGLYTCYLNSFQTISKNITLEVEEACQPNYIGGISWSRQISGQQARIRCSTFHRSFRPGVYITRRCDVSGEWRDVDYSSCTMRPDALPLVMVEGRGMVEVDASSFTSQVLQSLNTSSYVTNMVLSTTPSDGVVLVFVSINNETIPESITTDTERNIMLGSGGQVTVTAFQPSYQCSCVDRLMEDKLNHICIGPSVPPCTFVGGGFECSRPSYAGNGTLCGLDSDSDGYPDIQLDCEEDSCQQDECPFTYNPCPMQQVMGCQPENDTWGIEWQFVNAGTVAIQKCFGLSESSNLASRYCSEDGVWDMTTNVTQCESIELSVLRGIISEQSSILANNTNTTMMDLTTLFDINEVESVSEELSTLTNTSSAIVPNDLSTTNIVIETIVSITRTASGNNDTADAVQLTQIVETTSDTIDNLLDISNNASFETSKEMQLPVAEDFLRNIESFTIAIGDVLEANFTENAATENRTVTVTRDNIVMNAQLVPINPELISTIVFPEDFHTQITIPADAIKFQRSKEGMRVPVVNFIANNLQSYLGESDQQSSNMSGLMISSQISLDFIRLPENGTVKLQFNLPENTTKTRITATCVYWDFNLTTENNQTRGGWSMDGIIQDDDPSPPAVICNSTHLTSFSVLVSASSEAAETTPELRIVSYVGCGVSIVCLLVTITTIIYFRKTAFKAKHSRLHLNLSVALLLALLTFVSGIETAKDSKEGCIVVTVLLHYFFLAVFCWTLCEGIIILVMFVKVIYHGFFQRMYFFLLLGWGLPIPIVAVSAGLSYDNYGITADGKRTACWISDDDGAIWAFAAPVILIIVINIFIMIISLVKIYQARKLHAAMTTTEKATLDTAKILLMSIMALLPLLGGTWILGLLFLIDNDSVALAWIFTIVNSLQGAAIFFFHVVRNKEVVQVIKQKFAQWRKDRLLKSSLKDSTLDKNQNFQLKNKTMETSVGTSSTRLPPNHKYFISPFEGYSSFTVGDSFVTDDDKVSFADKEYLSDSQLY